MDSEKIQKAEEKQQPAGGYCITRHGWVTLLTCGVARNAACVPRRRTAYPAYLSALFLPLETIGARTPPHGVLSTIGLCPAVGKLPVDISPPRNVGEQGR